MKHVLIVGVLFGAGLTLGVARLTGAGDSLGALLTSWDAFDQTQQQSLDLDNQLTQARLFAVEFEQVRGAVLVGSLSLTEAGKRLSKAAQDHNPSLLRQCNNNLPGRTPGEQMVVVLLQRLEADSLGGRLTEPEKKQLTCLREESDLLCGNR